MKLFFILVLGLNGVVFSQNEMSNYNPTQYGPLNTRNDTTTITSQVNPHDTLYTSDSLLIETPGSSEDKIVVDSMVTKLVGLQITPQDSSIIENSKVIYIVQNDLGVQTVKNVSIEKATSIKKRRATISFGILGSGVIKPKDFDYYFRNSEDDSYIPQFITSMQFPIKKDHAFQMKFGYGSKTSYSADSVRSYFQKIDFKIGYVSKDMTFLNIYVNPGFFVGTYDAQYQNFTYTYNRYTEEYTSRKITTQDLNYLMSGIDFTLGKDFRFKSTGIRLFTTFSFVILNESRGEDLTNSVGVEWYFKLPKTIKAQ